MRALEPSATGRVTRNGATVAYEIFGDGAETILFLPPWSIVHSRVWKAQIAYFARHYRVITFDGVGNGASDRSSDTARYSATEFAADALAVMDATQTPAATLIALSLGAVRALILAAAHPERVRSLAFIAPAVPLAAPHPERMVYSFTEALPTDEGWAKYNQHFWKKDFAAFLEFFFGKMFPEPHSTKQIDDCIGWGMETTADVLIATMFAPFPDREEMLAICSRIKCPVLVLHGDDDQIVPHTRGAALAEAVNGTLITLQGSGHGPHARDPVKVNLLLRDFVDGPRSTPLVWTRGMNRPKRVLYISSPIGLGHAQRDVAIARELRKLVPGVEIDWLAQHPVTQMLRAEGERVHPASKLLSNESRHIESESAEHDLHCFHALRNMDEILIANFMVFHDLVREQQYDLWIGDEAWELDYYLHENPEQKRAAYVWLTDFVGWLPNADASERERFLTADYNAEMIEQIARFPRVRDRSIFVGQPDDIVDERFGPHLPRIREWTEDHFTFPGYVTGFDPHSLGSRTTMREGLGYGADEKVCIATVGGSAVGVHLLRRIAESFDEAKRRIPALRMVLVTGPRIDAASFTPREGLEVRPYVHNLYQHLAACDLAVVQGGLTTAMELTANNRPFLYFPLRHHFEQNIHVRHRLNRYGAGRCMDYDSATPDVIADAIVTELGRVVTYRPVETNGARRAAELIAALL